MGDLGERTRELIALLYIYGPISSRIIDFRKHFTAFIVVIKALMITALSLCFFI